MVVYTIIQKISSFLVPLNKFKKLGILNKVKVKTQRYCNLSKVKIELHLNFKVLLVVEIDHNFFKLVKRHITSLIQNLTHKDPTPDEFEPQLFKLNDDFAVEEDKPFLSASTETSIGLSLSDRLKLINEDILFHLIYHIFIMFC